MYLHLSGLELLGTLAELLAMKIFYLCLDCIYPSVSVLSVQKRFQLVVVVISLSQNPARSDPKPAASNSSFGLLSSLMSSTFFLITYRDVSYPRIQYVSNCPQSSISERMKLMSSVDIRNQASRNLDLTNAVEILRPLL